MRFLKAISFALLLSLLGVPAFSQSFEEGLSAFEEKDFATALEHFEPLANQGEADAQLFLGAMYANGEGVAQSDAKATLWLRRAAEQGSANAQFFLAHRYDFGSGVEQDASEAVKWYLLAAKQGQAEAQSNLGSMYRHGRGVTQNYSKALTWYRRAAEQGQAEAQFNLGSMYALGEGVAPNPILAYMLENLAAAQGHKMARFVRDESLKNLTAVQVIEGQRLAFEWQVGASLPTETDTWP